jgi:hypothetical protein
MSNPTTPTPPTEVARDAVDAAREMFAGLGMAPTLRLMRAVVAALHEAEQRGAASERERCIDDIQGERLFDEPLTESDKGYALALVHVENAIRFRTRDRTDALKP